MEKPRIEKIVYEVLKTPNLYGATYTGLRGLNLPPDQPKEPDRIPFGLVYSRIERRDLQMGGIFGNDYEAIFPVSEKLFRDLQENPSQIVRFNDFTFVELWENFDPTHNDSLEGLVAYIFFGREIRNKQELDDYYKTEFISRYGDYHPTKKVEAAKEGVMMVIRGEDSIHNRAVVITQNDHGRGGEMYYAKPNDLILDRWIEGGKLGAGMADSGHNIPLYFPPDPTPEGCEFLGKLLNAKVTIEEGTMNDNMPDGIRIVAIGGGGSGIHPDAKRKRFRIEPLNG